MFSEEAHSGIAFLHEIILLTQWNKHEYAKLAHDMIISIGFNVLDFKIKCALCIVPHAREKSCTDDQKMIII